MLQMWDTFIAETAYHVLAVSNFNDRGTYAVFSQMMYQQYPYIGVNLNKSMHEPWISIIYKKNNRKAFVKLVHRLI